MEKLPRWVKITGWILALVGPASGAIASVSLMIIDIRDKARVTEQKTEASYETLAPAIQEVQSILEDGQQWSEDTDKELEALRKANQELKDRLFRVENTLMRRAGHRERPLPPAEDAPNLIAELFEEPPVKMMKPKMKVPAQLEDAVYQQAQQQVQEAQ